MNNNEISPRYSLINIDHQVYLDDQILGSMYFPFAGPTTSTTYPLVMVYLLLGPWRGAKLSYVKDDNITHSIDNPYGPHPLSADNAIKRLLSPVDGAPHIDFRADFRTRGGTSAIYIEDFSIYSCNDMRTYQLVNPDTKQYLPVNEEEGFDLCAFIDLFTNRHYEAFVETLFLLLAEKGDDYLLGCAESCVDFPLRLVGAWSKCRIAFIPSQEATEQGFQPIEGI